MITLLIVMSIVAQQLAQQLAKLSSIILHFTLNLILFAIKTIGNPRIV